MKKLRIKPKKYKCVFIDYNIKKIITDNGAYSFDDIKFEYICKCDYQYLYVSVFGIVVTGLCINTNDFIILKYKGKSEYTTANRNLEYFIYKYRNLSKGGE